MEPEAGAPWEWQPSPKIRRETKTRIKVKIKQKGDSGGKKCQKPICESFPDTSSTCCMSYNVGKKKEGVTSSLF